MIRRPPIEDEDDDNDRWLVSYADFITLLFAFFVVMYGISSVHIGKYASLSNSMGSAFIGAQKGSGQTEEAEIGEHLKKTSLIKPLPLSYLEQEKKRDRNRKNMLQVGLEITSEMGTLSESGDIKLVQTKRGMRIDISEQLIFAPGSATLTRESDAVIAKLGKIIAKTYGYIQIEGHTDIAPIKSAKFFSNWELSTARATTILHLLANAGVLETHMSAVGYGSSLPLSVLNTPEANASNRRVSIMMLYDENNPDIEAAPVTKESTDQSTPQATLTHG
jgi:chemotaxis protein MotB